MSNVVAIIGRPNVGKSTLFNRLVKRREAIVDSTSGVTRDRHYGNSEWNGKKFTLIDTGGYLIGGNDRYEKEIHKQVKIAIDESDCILFLVDVEIGLNSSDMDVAKLLRQSSKPVFLVVNKVDNSTRLSDSSEFYSLGISKQFNISAINGSGTGDLLDELVKSFTIANGDKKDDLPRFAVIGRPNAGKSSFINSLIDEKRNIVNDEAGTTRDSIETYYNKYGFNFYLVDTAGIRKKSKILENIEFYSVMRSIKSIENSDICILIYDACREFDSQVKNIFWLAAKNHKGIVIVVNKWDLIDKKNNSTEEFIKKIKKEISPFTDVPIIFVSAINNQRIHKSIQTALNVFERRKNRIPTKSLNDYLLPIILRTPPPAVKGKYIKVKFVRQLPSKHPQFTFFCNLPQYVKEPYKRFLENKIREKYDFTGTTIDIFMRKK
ncbi:MAG: ribosome biogenesis GTPase Der [Bacteroidota bacterium]|jgi:GTP-binding protein|nr:ribosome biogenesis GTPase Der [Bacteroidota bacterium]|tara:strand:+ start:2464 stop:3768 length:1305 start_codon:yes stop_codon:yes gene_type:complete